MNAKPVSNKGAVLEEVLRAYFLRAGFFVIRGVPFRFADEDLTDVDLWLYERPTGSTRRIQICDIKYKQRPKAVERMFWTRGLAEALAVDGAYVATTDKRKNLRSVADKLNLELIDGNDVQRILSSPTTLFPQRIGDEDLVNELQAADREARNHLLQDARIDILSSVSEGFGAPSLVRALEGFANLASAVVAYHPGSQGARSAGRLAYLAAAISCQSLDFVSIDTAFRTLEERREHLVSAVRLGALSSEEGKRQLRLAMALVEKYAVGGRAAANSIEIALNRDLGMIPAEIIADQAIRLIKTNQLFSAGRELEMAAYNLEAPTPFDGLSVVAKSMLGALLDYAGVDREHFARAWTRTLTKIDISSLGDADSAPFSQSNLFHRE
jgi:hypothetical protein